MFTSNKISFSEKNYKCFIGYLDDFKTKIVSINLPKTSTYIKIYNEGTK